MGAVDRLQNAEECTTGLLWCSYCPISIDVHCVFCTYMYVYIYMYLFGSILVLCRAPLNV